MVARVVYVVVLLAVRGLFSLFGLLFFSRHLPTDSRREFLSAIVLQFLVPAERRRGLAGVVAQLAAKIKKKFMKIIFRCNRYRNCSAVENARLQSNL